MNILGSGRFRVIHGLLLVRVDAGQRSRSVFVCSARKHPANTRR